jgi:hypothetical protein
VCGSAGLASSVDSASSRKPAARTSSRTAWGSMRCRVEVADVPVPGAA